MQVLGKSANRGAVRVGTDAVQLGSYSAESLESSGTTCLLLPALHGLPHHYTIGQPFQPPDVHVLHTVRHGTHLRTRVSTLEQSRNI
jgi:hypothetical protein